MTIIFLAVFIGLVIAGLVPTLIGALMARLLGCAVSNIQLGVLGPKLTLKHSDPIIQIGLLPIASSCKLLDDGDESGAPYRMKFGDLSRVLRAVVHLSGPVLVLIMLTLMVGPSTVTSAPVQIIMGAFSPSAAQGFLHDYPALVDTSFGLAACIAATKIMVFNLFPLPPLSGGMALMELLRRTGGERPAWLETPIKVGLIVYFVIALSWAYSLFAMVTERGGLTGFR